MNENGRGNEVLLILIKSMPLQPNEKITRSDVAELLNPKDMKEFLPNGATYINSGELTLEDLPGFWVHCKVKGARVRNSLSMETIMYIVFYKDKMIQIHGQVMTSMNGTKIDHGGLKKYEKLFDLMVNSFVITDIYK